MKKILLTLLIALPMFGISQSNCIENFYSKYKDHEGITAFTLSGNLIQFAASFEEDENKKVMEKISQVRILVMDEVNLVPRNDFNGLLKSLKKDAFDELMLIKEEGTDIEIYIREKGNTISDVILMVYNEGEFIMLSVEGAFNYSDLNDLNLDFNGGEYLKKLPEKRSSIPRA
jgi:hypothetical protein